MSAEFTTCEYVDGRACGRPADVIIGAQGYSAPACNLHRVATVNALTAKFRAELAFVNLPHPMNMYTHVTEVTDDPTQTRSFCSESAAAVYAKKFKFALVRRIADETIVFQTHALFMAEQ